MKQYCPVCDCQMSMLAGNLFACPICDFTATDHQLERLRASVNLPGSRFSASSALPIESPH